MYLEIIYTINIPQCDFQAIDDNYVFLKIDSNLSRFILDARARVCGMCV